MKATAPRPTDRQDALSSSFSASYAGVVAFITVAIEGSFAREGEASCIVAQLERGEAEVEECPRKAPQTLGPQNLAQLVERSVHESDPISVSVEATLRAAERGGIAVQTEETGLRRQGFEQRSRMTASPYRGIQVPARPADEESHHLVRQDRDVLDHASGPTLAPGLRAARPPLPSSPGTILRRIASGSSFGPGPPWARNDARRGARRVRSGASSRILRTCRLRPSSAPRSAWHSRSRCDRTRRGASLLCRLRRSRSGST